MNRFPWQRFAALAACGVLLAASQALGQEYPSKPIRIVVPFPPGGLLDVYTRVIAKQLQERFKNPVLVENRTGAGGRVGTEAVVKSAPDGYTLIHTSPSAVSRVFMKDPPFDVYTALQPIASVWVTQFILTINSQVPAQTLKEFVDHVKANPGKLNFASSNGPNYLPMVLFASLAGLQMQSIEYKGGSQVSTALMTNEVQATFNTLPASMLGFINSGKLRVLTVTGSERMAVIPNVPTTTELGYPGMQAHAIGAVLAPVGVPSAVVAKLSPALKDIVGSPEMERLLRDQGGKPLIVGPEELTRLLRAEETIWEHAAKVAGFKPQ